MKRAATVALILSLGIAGIQAEPKPLNKPVKMTFSGSIIPTSLNLGPDTITDEENLAGIGTLGPFTLRKLRTDAIAPQPSAACSGPTEINLPVVTGAGVFRFLDGSLLTAQITGGALCIDLAALEGHLTETYQITGGTGHFKGASGALTLRATLAPVLADASGHPVLLTTTGEFDGTVSLESRARW